MSNIEEVANEYADAFVGTICTGSDRTRNTVRELMKNSFMVGVMYSNGVFDECIKIARNQLSQIKEEEK